MNIRPSGSKSGYIVSNLDEEEPIFVIRGNDVFGAMILRRYIEELGPDYFNAEKIVSLEKLAGHFRTWQNRNQGTMKIPD